MYDLRWVGALVATALLLIGCAEGSIQDEDARTGGEPLESCESATDWTRDPKSGDGTVEGPVYNVLTGAVRCYDQVGFVVNNPNRVGFEAGYATDLVGPEGAHMIRPFGERVLQVTIFAPAADSLNVGQAIPLDGDSSGYGVLQDVIFGAATADRSVFLLGVRGDLPFTVDSDDQGRRSSVTVRVAKP